MMSHRCKRFLCALLALLMLVGFLPAHAITVHAANETPIDAAVIFTDLHSMNGGDSSNGSNGYKESKVKGIMTALKNSGLPISSVTSGGDAFSLNKDEKIPANNAVGYTSTITGYIQSVLGSVSVNYVWSDHDRNARDEKGNLLDKTSHLVYGAGSDGIYGTADDDNYYVYALSMGDLCSYDRYVAGFNYSANDNSGRVAAGFTATVDKAIENFIADAAKLDKSKPLFISSHQPLFDNRNDNAHAKAWFDAINDVAKNMDVFFFYGHNHKYDSGSDYYYAKGSTMPVALPKSTSGKDWNYQYDTGAGKDGYLPDIELASSNETLNFTHMCAGYVDPGTTGSTSNTTRQGTVIAAAIYEDSITFTTYNSSGVYSGNYSVNTTVTRDFAKTQTQTHEHPLDSMLFAPTCTEDGTEVFFCTVCDYTYTETTVPAYGHEYYTDIIAPTCTENGYTAHICDNCEDTYITDEVVALGHNYTSVVTPPTNDADGYTTHTCQTCFDVYVDSYVASVGHKYTVTVTAPTCTAIGYTTHYCSHCGDRYNDNYVAALGHDYAVTIVAPTCTEQGYTMHKCSNCGDSYKNSYVAAPGHTYTSVVTAPTCTENGYTTFTCTECSTVTVGNHVSQTGHIYNCVESGNQLVYSCKNCTYSYSVEVEPEFAYKKVSKFANNSTYAIVMYTNNKYYALSHSNNRVSAVPVTVSSNQITSEVTEDLLWTHSGNKLSYEFRGITYLLNASSSKLSLSTSTSAKVSFSGTKLKIGTNYLRYASNAVSLNKTASTTYLFNQVKQ